MKVSDWDIFALISELVCSDGCEPCIVVGSIDSPDNDPDVLGTYRYSIAVSVSVLSSVLIQPPSREPWLSWRLCLFQGGRLWHLVLHWRSLLSSVPSNLSYLLPGTSDINTNNAIILASINTAISSWVIFWYISLINSKSGFNILQYLHTFRASQEIWNHCGVQPCTS